LGWASLASSNVVVHEFGHYGFGLWDEYLDRDGKEGTGAYCASNRGTVAFDNRSSIMDGDASEFCSTVDPNHQHMTNTQHDKLSGGKTTWESIVEQLGDSQVSPRWVLETPDDRGAIMTGPSAIPIDIVKVYSTNAQTGACQPFDLTVNRHDGTPATGAWVSLMRTAGTLEQGFVRQNGVVNIVGAHVGEAFFASLNGEYAYKPITSCAPTGLTLSGTPTITIHVAMAVIDTDSFEIVVAAGGYPIDPPLINRYQQGGERTEVPTTWDVGRSAWIATVDLDPSRELTGVLDVRFEEGGELVAAAVESFAILPLSTGVDNVRVMSPDGGLELVVPADSLDGEASVILHSTDVEAGTPAGLVRVGGPYGVDLSSGQESFDPPVVVNLRWDEVATDGVAHRTTQLYRLSDSTDEWELVGGIASTDHDIVSVPVDRLSVFAAFGQPAGLFSDGFESGDWSAWGQKVP
jgi:hypothetical protein